MSGEVSLSTARWVTLMWGVVVTISAVAVYFARLGSIVEIAAAVIGYFSGPLLGMFLLGMFSLRANSIGAILGVSPDLSCRFCYETTSHLFGTR